jgi:ATP phosphoribosyltransferase regulatory subunit
MTQLGSPVPIPAVGFSVWIEALTQYASQGSAA